MGPYRASVGGRTLLCPVCGGGVVLWRAKITAAGHFQIDRCGSCGYAFVNPRPSLEYLMHFYGSSGHHIGGEPSEVPATTAKEVLQREAQYPNSTLDARRIVRTILEFVQRKSTMLQFLDVGCGYGFFSREARRKGFDVHALELASGERRIARDIAAIEAQAVSFEEFEGEARSFDVILMSQILEHALDVNLWVEKSFALLADDGILAVALPNFDSVFRMIMQENEPFICPPAHLNFFSPRSLARLLRKHGFEVLKTQWISRIPATAFEKRFPRFARQAVVPVADAAAKLLLNSFDLFRRGQIINLYASKAKCSSRMPEARAYG
jgi:2-polyprenyl-3-methyl-5-hydroxy-6-metoxy-1,4-benzoquinol methylase